MTVHVNDGTPLDAGRLSTWLEMIQEVIRNDGTSDVPCGSCTACCASSQFVHISPDEVETLASIPTELLFPAPRRPKGHVLMGYDEHGHCPMLVGGKCSIYEQRPRTCRTYDCRVFAASGLLLDDPGKSAINEQVSRWQFQLPEEIDQIKLQAVRRATAILEEQEPGFSVTERTLAAIERHGQFLAPGTAQDEEVSP